VQMHALRMDAACVLCVWRPSACICTGGVRFVAAVLVCGFVCMGNSKALFQFL